MPTFEITAPDGTKYRVTAPEGATEADALARVRQEHGGPSKFAQSMQKQPDMSGDDIRALLQKQGGATSSLGAGLADPFVGAAQLASRALPGTGAAQAIDNYVKNREQNLSDLRGPNAGTDWSRIAGNVASPANLLPMAALGKAATIGEAATMGARAGAISGALDPVTGGGDFWRQKERQAEFGALGGAVTGPAGSAVSSVIAPKLGEVANKLAVLGIPMTPGQMAGGIFRSTENALTSIPVVGDLIKGAQRRGIEGYNRAMYDQVLKPVGLKLPSDIPVGRDAVKFTQDAVGAKFNEALEGTSVVPHIGLIGDLGRISDDHLLPETEANHFQRFMQERVYSRFGSGEGMDGRTFKQVESELTNEANDWRRSTDGGQKKLAEALDDAKEALRNEFQLQNPKQAPKLAAARKAYAMLSRAEEASTRRVSSEGLFTPADMLATLKADALRTGRRKAYAGSGDGELLQPSLAAQSILPSNVPDSGSAGRAITGVLASGTAAHFMAPQAVPPMAALAGLYSKWGQSVTNRIVQPAGTVRNVLAQIAASGGQAAGAALGEQSNSLIGR